MLPLPSSALSIVGRMLPGRPTSESLGLLCSPSRQGEVDSILELAVASGIDREELEWIKTGVEELELRNWA